MKIILGIALTTLTFLSGCLFSGSDVEETKMVDNYYLSSLGGNTSLVYKDSEAATDNLLIPGNVDSIGWNSSVIVAVSGKNYFIVNRQTQAVNKSNDWTAYVSSYQKLGIKDNMPAMQAAGTQTQ